MRPVTQHRGVSFAEACARLGFTTRTGRRYLREGTFPIAELKRLSPRAQHRFSTFDIERYLMQAAADARPARRSVPMTVETVQ